MNLFYDFITEAGLNNKKIIQDENKNAFLKYWYIDATPTEAAKIVPKAGQDYISTRSLKEIFDCDIRTITKMLKDANIKCCHHRKTLACWNYSDKEQVESEYNPSLVPNKIFTHKDFQKSGFSGRRAANNSYKCSFVANRWQFIFNFSIFNHIFILSDFFNFGLADIYRDGLSAIPLSLHSSVPVPGHLHSRTASPWLQSGQVIIKRKSLFPA